jgi:hypothetical protein
MPSSQLKNLNLLPTRRTTKPRWINCLSPTPNLTKLNISLTPLLKKLQTRRLFKKFPLSFIRIKSPISNFTLTTCILMILKTATTCSSAAKRIAFKNCSALSSPRSSTSSLNTSTATKTSPGVLRCQKKSRMPNTKRSANLWIKLLNLNGKKTPP